MKKIVWGFVGGRGIEFGRGFYPEDHLKEAFIELVRINAPIIEANIAAWGEDEYYMGKTHIEICYNHYFCEEVDNYWIPDEDDDAVVLAKLTFIIHD